MLDTHREVASHNGYTIYQRQPGFEFTPVMLAKIASHIVQNEEGQWAVYAFMYSLLSLLDGQKIDEADLLTLAVDAIIDNLDSGEFAHRQERTYEYRNGSFTPVGAPGWWVSVQS